jgi:hypothetical protein
VAVCQRRAKRGNMFSTRMKEDEDSTDDATEPNKKKAKKA